jgi:Chaperone of endosialidase
MKNFLLVLFTINLASYISAQNVGIGTELPTEKLQVVGNISLSGSLVSLSDMRYKNQVTTINNALSRLMTLDGLYYFWNQNVYPELAFSTKRQIGFDAQKLEALFPELVLTGSAGVKSVDYGRLTPVLVEAIKELNLKVEQQQQMIRQMAEEISALMKQ